MRMFAIYDDRGAAGRGVEKLLEASFDARRIRVIFFDDAGPEEAIVEHHTNLGSGAAVGAVLGSLVGVAATAAGLVAPDVGVIGGLTSGLVAGALAGVTFWRKELELPHSAGAGGVLVAVPAMSESRRAQARRVFESTGGQILAHGATAAPTTAGAAV